MKKVEFMPPAGFTLPEGAQVGDRLEFMCEVDVAKGGKLCLASLDGEDMPGYGPNEKDESEEGFGSRVRRYMAEGPDNGGNMAPPGTAAAQSVVQNTG